MSAPVVDCLKGIATAQFRSGHPPLPERAGPEIRAYRSGDLIVSTLACKVRLTAFDRFGTLRVISSHELRSHPGGRKSRRSGRMAEVLFEACRRRCLGSESLILDSGEGMDADLH